MIFGSSIMAPRNREHLLLAAAERAAGLAAALAEHREVSEHLVEQFLLALLGDAAASSPVRKFSITVSRRKMRRSSGT